MLRMSLLKCPCVKVDARRSFSMSSNVRIGWDTSRRITGSVESGESRFGRGPMNDTSDITSCSRIGSIGGLVTCAESWREYAYSGFARVDRTASGVSSPLEATPPPPPPALGGGGTFRAFLGYPQARCPAQGL